MESRRLQSCLALMYHIRYDLVDIRWSAYLTEASSRTRGCGSCFMIPSCSTQVYASSFFPPQTQGLETPGKGPCHFILPRCLQNRVAGASRIRLHLAFIFTRTCMYLHNLVVSAMFHACAQPQCGNLHPDEAALVWKEGRPNASIL